MSAFEQRDQAEELYVLEGLTLEKVAEQMQVSVRTVENWSAAGKWKEKQKEYRNATADIARYTRLTKLKLIKQAMQSLDPQQVYAFAALERATAANKAQDPAELVEGTQAIKTPEDAVEALQKAVELKINGMIANPANLSLSGLKDMKKALELIDEMKARYVVETETKPEGETAEKDRARLVDEVDAILGVKK